MRRVFAAVMLLGLCLFGASYAFSQKEGGRGGQGVFAVLSKGQAISVKEVGGRYEVGLFTDGPDMLGYKVVEVGQDYLAVEDITGVTELRIPIYSVKAVSILRTSLPKRAFPR